MFEELSIEDARGQVGIGTLIIFIALVLVAAVAAGVLVQTSGLLQAQAESTGEDAQSEVGNQISVVSATGAVTNDSVSTVNITVKKSAGSDPIDLEDATIEYTSAGAAETLTYNGSADAGNFSTTNISAHSSTVMMNTGGRIKVTIDTAAIEDNDGIVAGDEATLRIVDQSGATTIYGVNVPDSLGDRSYVSV